MRFLSFIYCIFLCIGLSNKSNCQIRSGVKFGPNLSKGKFEQGDTEFLLQFHLGLLSEIPLSKKVYLRPELLYSKKGWKVNNVVINNVVTNTSNSIRIDYLNLPIIMGYKLSEKIAISTGPELGLKLNIKFPSGLDPYEDIDTGWVIGGSYLAATKIGFDIRYVHGFKGLYKAKNNQFSNFPINVPTDGANRLIQVSMVYFFYYSSKK